MKRKRPGNGTIDLRYLGSMTWNQRPDPFSLAGLSRDPFDPNPYSLGFDGLRQPFDDGSEVIAIALSVIGFALLLLVGLAWWAFSVAGASGATPFSEYSILAGVLGGVAVVGWILLVDKARSAARNIADRVRSAIGALRAPVDPTLSGRIVGVLGFVEHFVPKRLAGDEFAMLPEEVKRLVDKGSPTWLVFAKVGSELLFIAFNAVKLIAITALSFLKLWRFLDR